MIRNQTSVERVVRIAAPPETVFSYLIDPQKMVRWKGSKAELDPRPGGIYRVTMPGQNVARGEYVEVRRPERVVFTWGWEGDINLPPGSSTVEVTLTPDGDGTLLRLVHRDLPELGRKTHAEGWEHFLDRLATAARGGDPGPDPWAQAQPPADSPTA
jgi:uncharacterized protein YndB with AHSA1/START domain